MRGSKPKFLVNIPISNFDIEEWMKYLQVSKFHGIFSRDEIMKFSKSGCYIINLNESWQPGSHWIAILIENDNLKNRYGDTIKCFDSFGLPPTEEIIALSERLKKNYIFNSNQYQKLDSVTCGYFCIYFVNESCNDKKTFWEVIKPFSIRDMNKNEKFVREYFENI